MSVRGRRFSQFAIGLIFSCAATSLCAATPKSESIDEAFAKAFNANDLEGVVKLYADDAVAWFPEEPEHRGAAAIRASFKSFFEQNKITAFSLSNEHHESEGNHYVSWGNYTLTFTQKSDGKSMTYHGRFTDVAEKRGGRWVYVADHVSGEPPPPAAPAAPAKTK